MLILPSPISGFRRCVCFVLILWGPWPVASFAQEPELTPGNVVRLWQTVFPANLERAANMTTLSFRQGVSREQWIETQGPLLQGMQMRYGKGEVLYEDIRGDEARVIMRVRVSSWMGSDIKNELYSLVKGPEGLWFVDRVDEFVGDLNALE